MSDRAEANFARLEQFAAQAARQGARLVAFPECCLTGYWFLRNLGPQQLDALAKPFPAGPSSSPPSPLRPLPSPTRHTPTC